MPVTVAANACAPPVCTVKAAGEIETAIADCSDTSTVAVAVLPGSAWAAATTRKVPAAFGAVKSPALSTVPPSGADQVTAPSALPVIVARKRAVAPATRVTRAGSMETEIAGAPVVTVISASAICFGSAWLAAARWNTPAEEGAL